jgi:FkbM family methyltransferase
MITVTLARRLISIYRAIRLRMLRGEKSWQKVSGNVYMKIDPNDFMDRAFLFGYYERELYTLIHSLVQPGDVCIDVGAHKGYITLQLGKRVGERGLVIAIEPDPYAREELLANCEKNGFAQVVVLSCALSNAQGQCEFYLSSQLGHSTRFQTEMVKRTIHSQIQVETKTLDQVVQEYQALINSRPLSFVKIDAEGSEPLILAGAQRVLNEFKPVLWVEVNRPLLARSSISPALIEEILRAAGYQLYLTRWDWDLFLRGNLNLLPVRSLEAEVRDCENVVAVSDGSEYRQRLRSKHIRIRE